VFFPQWSPGQDVVGSNLASRGVGNDNRQRQDLENEDKAR